MTEQDVRHTRIRFGAPEFTTTFDIDNPLDLDVGRLDDWLRRAYDLEAHDAPVDDAPVDDAPADPASRRSLAAAWRTILLARTLLIDSEVPVPGFPRVIGLKARSDRPRLTRVSVAVAATDVVRPELVQQVFRYAATAVARMSVTPVTPESMSREWDETRSRVIGPLSKIARAGRSTCLILNAAHELGIPYRHVGAGIFQLGWGANATLINRGMSESDSLPGSLIARNKKAANHGLGLAGLPVPRQFVVNGNEQAFRAATALGWPVVVKPMSLERGEGVTIAVRGKERLDHAVRLAQQAGRLRFVLVEEQVEGTCYRVLIARSTLVYAVKRCPKSVIGDGSRPVARLIEHANAARDSLPPWRRDAPYPDDEQAEAAMAAAGFKMSDVPEAGAIVPLRAIESTHAGGFDIDVTDEIHPANVDIAVRAARACRLSTAGVDIISTDISAPWFETGARINEVNSSPLLGGAEISRSYLPKYLRLIVDGDGRIPVWIFVGRDAALRAARRHRRRLERIGGACFLATADETLDDAGNKVNQRGANLYDRCQSLLLDPRVQMLVLVVQDTRMLRTGLPIDRAQGVYRFEPLEDDGERVSTELLGLVDRRRAPARDTSTGAAFSNVDRFRRANPTAAVDPPANR